jgi:hypothetical protein
MLKLITGIHPAHAGFLDAASRRISDSPDVTLSVEWRALSRCGERVANAGYILLNVMYRLVRQSMLFGHYPHRAVYVCRLQEHFLRRDGGFFSERSHLTV